MSEVIWDDIDKNKIVLDNKNIIFAYGDDPGSFRGLLVLVHLILFPFALSLFQFLLKKYPVVVEEYQFPVVLVCTLVLIFGSFFLLNKRFASNKVNVPLDQRKKTLSIDLLSKQVILKENNTVTDTFSLTQDDYFWFPEQSSRAKSYKGTTTYVISFVHKNQQTVLASTGSFSEIEKLYTKLRDLGFAVKKDN